MYLQITSVWLFLFFRRLLVAHGIAYRIELPKVIWNLLSVIHTSFSMPTYIIAQVHGIAYRIELPNYPMQVANPIYMGHTLPSMRTVYAYIARAHGIACRFARTSCFSKLGSRWVIELVMFGTWQSYVPSKRRTKTAPRHTPTTIFETKTGLGGGFLCNA